MKVSLQDLEKLGAKYSTLGVEDDDVFELDEEIEGTRPFVMQTVVTINLARRSSSDVSSGTGLMERVGNSLEGGAGPGGGN